MSEDFIARRKFVKQLGLGAASLLTPAILSNAQDQQTRQKILTSGTSLSSAGTIRIAGIGMGIMGFMNIKTALRIPGVKLIGVCDLYDGRLIRAKEVFGKNIITTRNYSELLNRKDVDAIIVSTTDHWHNQIAVEALACGKHVYCEKPMVKHIEEGHAIIDAQNKSKKVFQVGAQRISNVMFHEAKRLYQNGEIGEVNFIEANTDRHSALGAWQYSIPPDASASTIDWSRFLGTAPNVPFDPVRFFRWRNYMDYGTGLAGDLFVHLISGIHMMFDSLGPTRIFSSGGLSYWKDGRDVPDVMTTILEYPKTDKHAAFQVSLRVNFADGSGGGESTKVIGTDGMMNIGWSNFTLKKQKLPKAPGYGGWDSFDTFPLAIQQEFVKQYQQRYSETDNVVENIPDMVYTLPAGYNDKYEHMGNFFEAIRSNTPSIEDAVFGLRACGPALAANKSYFEKKVIHWDPVNMKIVN